MTRTLVKEREVGLRSLAGGNQAAQAAAVAIAYDGVHSADAIDSERLRVAYDLYRTSLADVETGLSEAGFHLDNSLIAKLRRALYYYSDETLQASLMCTPDSPGCRQTKVFVKRYKERPKGCRDPRPEHWRGYR